MAIAIVEMTALGENVSACDPQDQLLSTKAMRADNAELEAAKKNAEKEATRAAQQAYFARLMLARLRMESIHARMGAAARSIKPSPVAAKAEQAAMPAKKWAMSHETRKIIRRVVVGVMITGVIGLLMAACAPVGLIAVAVVAAGFILYKRAGTTSQKSSWTFSTQPELPAHSATCVR